MLGADLAGLDLECGLQIMFELERASVKGIDLLLHDGGASGLSTLRRFAELTKETGLQHRTAVSHAYWKAI